MTAKTGPPPAPATSPISAGGPSAASSGRQPLRADDTDRGVGGQEGDGTVASQTVLSLDSHRRRPRLRADAELAEWEAEAARAAADALTRARDLKADDQVRALGLKRRSTWTRVASREST